jgi:hypothetical protein
VHAYVQGRAEAQADAAGVQTAEAKSLSLSGKDEERKKIGALIIKGPIVLRAFPNTVTKIQRDTKPYERKCIYLLRVALGALAIYTLQITVNWQRRSCFLKNTN